MKIIVCCKAVPDGISKVSWSETEGKIIYKSFSLVINESDEYALEEALQIKKLFGAEVTVVTVGSLKSQTILHQALAKGADKVIRIDTEFAESAESSVFSKILAKAIEKMEYDLILTGSESSDNMSSKVGVSLAEMLKLPCVFAVNKIEMGQVTGAIKTIRDLGQGIQEVIETPTPAVLCIQTSAYPVSSVSIPRLQRARGEPVGCITQDSLRIDWDKENAKGLKILEVFKPQRVSSCEIIQGSPQEIAIELKRKIDRVLQ
jgi:electron transfer flavoprotein beta subunit